MLIATFSAGAQVPATTVASTEVAQLLAFVETSGCEFQRNGSWSNSRAARSHLAMKYDYLQRRDMVKSADDFIALAATASSLSGSAYKVRCPGAPVTTSAAWLNTELARLRAKPPRLPQ